MKRLLNLIIAAVMLIAVAMVPISCGTRKVNTAITDVKDQQSQSDKSGGQTKTESSTSGSSDVKEKADKTDESQVQKITELYDENGKLKSRVTELENRKVVDLSTKESKSLYETETKRDSNFYTDHYITRTVTIHTKDKDTETSNKSLYWVLFGLGALGLLIWLVPKAIKNLRV